MPEVRAVRHTTHSPMDSHLNRQLEENIDWLMDECGIHPEVVAKRVGITFNTLEKNRNRRGLSAARNTGEVAADRGSEGGAEMPPVRRSRPSRRVAPPTKQERS